MSKSLGNFFTVRDITKDYPHEVVRFFMLNAHYRSPVNFSRELMESAANGLKRITTGAKNLGYVLENLVDSDEKVDEDALLAQIDGYAVKFEEAMDDDFNTADAVAAIFLSS